MTRPGAVLRLTLALGLAAGCSTVIRPEALQAWVGRPAATIEADWGPATRVVEDGALRILIYEQLERKSGGDFANAAPSLKRSGYEPGSAAAKEAYRNPRVYARSYLFWVNSEGTIVHADVREP